MIRYISVPAICGWEEGIYVHEHVIVSSYPKQITSRVTITCDITGDDAVTKTELDFVFRLLSQNDTILDLGTFSRKPARLPGKALFASPRLDDVVTFYNEFIV